MKYLFLILALLTAPVAFSADGDSARPLQATGETPGKYREACFYLCHEKDSADSTCSEFDFQTLVHGGIPSKATVEIYAATGCTGAYSVDINQGSVSGGTEHDLVTLNASTTAASLGSDVVIRRFWNTDLATMTSCATDTFQVVLCAYYGL